jgi:hypothetical protein
VERNRKAGQNQPRVVAPTEEEEEKFICSAIFGNSIAILAVMALTCLDCFTSLVSWKSNSMQEIGS